MSLKLLISNINRWLSSKRHLVKPLLNPDLHLTTVEEQPVTPVKSIVRRRSGHNGGRKAVEFNIAEAIRLRAQGWTNRRIAWELKCGSEETVRLRLAKFQQASVAAIAAAQPDAVQVRPETPAVATPPPLANAAIQMPVQTPELTQQAPVHSQPHPAEPYLELLDNDAELCHRSEWFATMSGWRQDFFLVNSGNPLNLEFCTNNQQHAVSLARWDESYRGLEVFKNAAKIWIVLNPNDSNDVFLGSIVNDIWVREKSLVAVGSLLDICKWKVDARVGRIGFNGIKTDFSTFESVWKFQPCPQPNHTAVIAKLLEKPVAAKLTPLPQSFGTSEPWMSGGSGYAPSADWKPKIPSGGNPDGNDGSGFAF